MNDLLVFDIYTAKVFGIIAAFIALVSCIIFLIRVFPRQAELAGRMVIPLFVILMLGFCALQIAQLERHNAAYEHSRGEQDKP